jgi:hypothetical protein
VHAGPESCHLEHHGSSAFGRVPRLLWLVGLSGFEREHFRQSAPDLRMVSKLKREYLRSDLEVNQAGISAKRERNEVRLVHGPDITSRGRY